MSEKQKNHLGLKPIIELLEYNFFIPDYQRGYRWTHTQVIQLLDDVWNFAKTPPLQKQGEEKPFYCLQPIVLKSHNENEWEVIDGQQRLTTISLIIHYFNEMWIGKQKIKEPEISYETRSDSSDFISSLEIEIEDFDTELEINEALNIINVTSSSQNENNIDYFHIANAYKAIHIWVKKLGNKLDNNKFQSIFQNDTKVIWYEVEETENNNSIDIFTRLNIGKIPLTNAELIKALFLQKGNFSDTQASLKQIQIASEWDTIEKTLQDDSFWLFIYNPNNSIKYDNRIEYIFDLIKKRKIDSEYYHTFNEFYKDFLKNKKPDIDKIWLGIKRFFLTFEEWYKDHVLFHHIGYLINCGISINVIKDSSENKTKIEFKDYLKSQIKEQVSCDLDEIEYSDKRIKKILLLFNIQTILETQKSEIRFPFHKYKTENWDIEHVRSQTDKTINGKERITWIEDMLDYFFGTSDLSEVKKIVESLNVEDDNKEIYNFHKVLIELKEAEKIDDEKFEELFIQIQSYFNENKQTEEKDDISNLALLDAVTNRSYGNSFFPIKRKRIIRNDSQGIFVPIATKNLFLKYYSRKVDDIMYWHESDAKDYVIAIKTKLNDFLPKKEEK
jgi:hypothetical protein